MLKNNSSAKTVGIGENAATKKEKRQQGQKQQCRAAANAIYTRRDEKPRKSKKNSALPHKNSVRRKNQERQKETQQNKRHKKSAWKVVRTRKYATVVQKQPKRQWKSIFAVVQALYWLPWTERTRANPKPTQNKRSQTCQKKRGEQSHAVLPEGLMASEIVGREIPEGLPGGELGNFDQM